MAAAVKASTAVSEFHRAHAAGGFAFVPPYPLGHCQVDEHAPWSPESVRLFGGIFVALGVLRGCIHLLAPVAGRAVGRRLHGKGWAAEPRDWRRLSDVSHCTLLHVAASLYFAIALRRELAEWASDPRQLWAVVQPALSPALRLYYVFQLASTAEMSVAMARSLASGRAKDGPMLVHHAATLFVVIAAWRLGFVRVGALVVLLFDATDVPIDGIRLGQLMQAFPLLGASAAAAVVSWLVVRFYAFPRFVILPALTATDAYWATYAFVPPRHMLAGYALYLVPLAVLWLLNLRWLLQLTSKLRSAVRQAASPTLLHAGTLALGLVVLAAVAYVETLAAAATPAAAAARASAQPSARRQSDYFAALERDYPQLVTPQCLYFNLSEAVAAPARDHLHPAFSEACDPHQRCDGFDGASWTRWTSHNWQYPLVAVGLYLAGVPAMQAFMAARDPIRLQRLTALWNFGLSAFSWAGAAVVVPHLLSNPDSGLLREGFHASICSHASSYGCGWVGFFVAAFIYSKFAELIDTLLLLLRKAPVITLHWYHHATVLLYCWHSYSARIGTGIWFAAMNYSVHAVMYAYFGLTQCGPAGKRFAKRFSMLITLMQLAQMVVGIAVTVASLAYQARGQTCYVPIVNSFLGLLMYASYFVLFFVLFCNLYLRKKDRHGEGRANGSPVPPSPPKAASPADRFEGWAVKYDELEMLTASASEAMNDVCLPQGDALAPKRKVA